MDGETQKNTYNEIMNAVRAHAEFSLISQEIAFAAGRVAPTGIRSYASRDEIIDELIAQSTGVNVIPLGPNRAERVAAITRIITDATGKR